MQTVLIIDDDRIIASIYRTKLRQEGFAAEVAADGEQALALASRIKPTAILLDLMLPKMSGIDVLKAIRADTAFAETPVVVLSNTYVRGAIGEAWGAGADNVLLKSDVTPNQVITAIRESIATRAARSGASPERVGAPATAIPPRRLSAAGHLRTARRYRPTRSRGCGSNSSRMRPGPRRSPGSYHPRAMSLRPNPHARVTHWLGALLAEMEPNTALITPTVVRTVTKALTVLSRDPAVPPTRDHRWLALALHKDAPIRSALRIGLEQAGFAVIVVSTSEVAFGVLRDNRFDVILSELSGISVMRAALAKSAFPPPPILEVLSTEAGTRAPGSRSAASYTLCAPWTSSELALLVWTAVEARPQAS